MPFSYVKNKPQKARYAICNAIVVAARFTSLSDNAASAYNVPFL